MIVYARRFSYDTSQYKWVTKISCAIVLSKPDEKNFYSDAIFLSMVVRHFYQNVLPDSYVNYHTKLEKYRPRTTTRKRKKCK